MHCQFAYLVPNRALWVPYGWRCIVLTRSTLHHSHALYVPYINTRMLMTCPLKEEIIAYGKRANQEWGHIMGQEPCASLAGEAQAWLEKVASMEDVASSIMPVTSRAIED